MSETTFDALHTGNNDDDDAQVIDSFLTDTTEPPGLVPIDLVTVAKESWPKIERLNTATFIIAPGWAPVLAMPKDPNRMHLTIRVTGFTTTDEVWFADDGGKISILATAFKLNGAQPSLTIDDFTGPLYLAPNPANGASITVSVMAVTK